MHSIFTRILTACLFALPTFAFAAENAAGVKPVAPAQAVVASPSETLQKPAAAAQSPRIGYVDMVRIATESERGKALKGLLAARKDKLQVKIDSKKKQIEKTRTSIEAKIASLTPQQREAKGKEFQKKVEEFQKLAQASEEELLALQDKESRALYEAVEQSALDHGKANNFVAIVVKKELLYVGNYVDAQDVTDALIKALNQDGQKK